MNNRQAEFSISLCVISFIELINFLQQQARTSSYIQGKNITLNKIFEIYSTNLKFAITQIVSIVLTILYISYLVYNWRSIFEILKEIGGNN